jgi:S-adenosylmethionine-diacylglycerol 3-amino-3-carboxypropyl transferase
MADALPSWVEQAAQLPIAFAQVREDPLLDVRVVEQLAPAGRILMIASGGCTLALLATQPRLDRIDVVDPNPAQIALARVKLHLLRTAAPSDRLALLGHVPMPAEEREMRLRAVLQSLDLPAEAIGPPRVWSVDGPDHAGRYERVFAQLRKHLESHAEALEQLLSLRDPAEQARRADPATALGRALDEAFDRAMALPILVRLFGEGATRNRVEPFSRHFARRTRCILAALPAADNPYLWQVLAGRYPPRAAAPWLAEPPPQRMPNVAWHVTAMTEALRGAAGKYDFIHLSNILDWLSPQEAWTTLDLAHAALRDGGWTLIRQLNSTLDIARLGEGFTWHSEEAQALHARDRSFFYRSLHLGRKR